MKALLLSLLLLTAAAVPAEVPPDVELVPVPGISGLNAPLGLKHAGDGSGRIFIVDQGGTVRVIDANGTLLGAPFIDLGDRVVSGGERGLLDIAFHPQFDANGRFFLHYSTSADPDLDPPSPVGALEGDTVVAEFSVSADPNVANAEPERIILTVAQDFVNHNGGQMKFGPDGYLYLGLGDGGGAGDPCNRAQTLDPAELQTGGGCRSDPRAALLGKMLRVDVDSETSAGSNNLCAANPDGSANYSVPAENPFTGQPDRCGEVLLYGLRNPWRWSFDRATGDLWIGDVGQNQWEEIDLLPAPAEGTFGTAENLGWNCFEASSTFSNGGACPPPAPVFPVLEYDHATTGGCSVTGGYRYRGFIRSLRGRYIFGDFCSGDIWFADNSSGNWERGEPAVFSDVVNIRSFGEDELGNLYVVADDQLHRFIGEEIFIDEFESP
ncbi:MAG: PQQ-dependent sugar dehydrogenase [Wenzhouxiangellaceae bacterium]